MKFVIKSTWLGRTFAGELMEMYAGAVTRTGKLSAWAGDERMAARIGGYLAAIVIRRNGGVRAVPMLPERNEFPR